MSAYIVDFFAVIGVFMFITLVHEGGHFVVAKLVGMNVTEFAFGMGPKLCGKMFKGTEYTLRAFPIGGFNRIAGMSLEKELVPGDYYACSITKRNLVIVAGAVMNIICGFLCFFTAVYFFNDVPVGFTKSLSWAMSTTIQLIVAIGQLFFKVFAEGRVEMLSGPVGLVSVASVFAKKGLVEFILFAGTFQINLGIANLMPIPLLDGGHIVQNAVEFFRKKKPTNEQAEVISYAGLAVIGFMIIAGTYQDIVKLLS